MITIVTNGDMTGDHLRELGITYPVIPWRDVLYDGPVYPATDNNARAQLRSSFLASCGWGESDALNQSMVSRNEALQNAAERGKVLFLFEEDLCDALQFLEADAVIGSKNYRFAITREFLITLGRDEIDELIANASDADLLFRGTVGDLFSTFCDANPFALVDRVRSLDGGAAPLKKGLSRLFEEYPGLHDGLSRSERQLLNAIEGGATTPRALFSVVQRLEEEPYASDWSLWRYLERLSPLLVVTASGRPFVRVPLVEEEIFSGQILNLTELGEAVLRKEVDVTRMLPAEKWLGGTQLTADRAVRWDEQGQILTLRGGVM